MGLKVFVFDDDELIRSTLTFFLEQEGYEVSAFSQPDHCPLYYSNDCMCTNKRPCADIIITDLNMPGQSGVNFIEDQISKGCKVEHIAVMTGDWGDPALQKARDMGCMLFQKPFSILHLRKWLEGIRHTEQSVMIPPDPALLTASANFKKTKKPIIFPAPRPILKVEK